MTRKEFKEYATAAIAEQHAFAATHGNYLRPLRHREVATRHGETATGLPRIGDELIRKKRRLERVVRGHGKRGAGVSVGLRGAKVSVGPRGLAATLSLLGTGLAYGWRRSRS